MPHILLSFIGFICLFASFNYAEAKENNTMINDETVCLYHTSLSEKKFGIRENLLSTIAIVETGRYNPKQPLGVNPWPWTVTSPKGSKYHNSKAEAIAEVKKLLKEGINSIDVGCMQINLKFHGKAFKSIEDAFNPKSNTAYAAKYLTELYAETKSWGKAATRYHSGNPEKSSKYEQKLIKAWRNIKDKNQDITVVGLSKPNAVKTAYSQDKLQDVMDSDNMPIRASDSDINDWRKEKIAQYMQRKKLQEKILTSDI